MHIIEVIREVHQEGLIYFLLTAYIEAALREPDPSSVPAWVRRLPIDGKDDVQARFDALSREFETAHRETADGRREKIAEALAVFRCAAERLNGLDEVATSRGRDAR